MMSPSYIEHLSTQFAARAELSELEPYLVEPGELATWKARVARGGLQRLPFPAIGTFEPSGWREARVLFADSSGFGSEFEPALTNAQLVAELIPGKAYAIGECGQFQCYVREFEPAPHTDSTTGERVELEPCDNCRIPTPPVNLYASPYGSAQYCAGCFLQIEGDA